MKKRQGRFPGAGEIHQAVGTQILRKRARRIWNSTACSSGGPYFKLEEAKLPEKVNQHSNIVHFKHNTSGKKRQVLHT